MTATTMSGMSTAFLFTGRAARETSTTLNLGVLSVVDALDPATVAVARALLPGWSGTWAELLAAVAAVIA